MTSKFHHCLKDMESPADRNVAFNTLLAIALPDFKRLSELPSTTGKWQRSSLKKYSSMIEVVWIAKEHEWIDGGQDYDGIVEASFVGTRAECLNFLQVNNHVPKMACRVKCDVKNGKMRVVPREGTDVMQSSELDLSWLVTNELQKAVVDMGVSELPDGLFELDPDQQRILLCTPPLLLESRSGTGKTNCLFWWVVGRRLVLFDLCHRITTLLRLTYLFFFCWQPCTVLRA